MVEELDLEKCNFPNFRDRVTLGHTAYCHASVIDEPNFIEIGKTFLSTDGLTAGTPPSLRSRDTKSRTNIKNLASTNLDIVL